MRTRDLFTILLLTTLTACSDKAEENMDGFYPMNIGNSWNYECTCYTTSYDSTGKFVELSHYTQIETTKIAKDTFINGMVLRQFLNTYYVKPRAFTMQSYYRQDSEGLKKYGHTSNPETWITDEIIDSIAQQKIHSISPRYKTISNQYHIILYDYPCLEIPTSLSDGLEWNCNLYIRKRIVGKDTLLINGKQYPCYKVETIDPESYKYYYEWFSNAGLLKRESETVKNDYAFGDSSYGQYVTHVITIVKSLDLK